MEDTSDCCFQHHHRHDDDDDSKNMISSIDNKYDDLRLYWESISASSSSLSCCSAISTTLSRHSTNHQHDHTTTFDTNNKTDDNIMNSTLITTTKSSSSSSYLLKKTIEDATYKTILKTNKTMTNTNTFTSSSQNDNEIQDDALLIMKANKKRNKIVNKNQNKINNLNGMGVIDNGCNEKINQSSNDRRVPISPPPLQKMLIDTNTTNDLFESLSIMQHDDDDYDDNNTKPIIPSLTETLIQQQLVPVDATRTKNSIFQSTLLSVIPPQSPPIIRRVITSDESEDDKTNSIMMISSTTKYNVYNYNNGFSYHNQKNKDSRENNKSWSSSSSSASILSRILLLSSASSSSSSSTQSTLSLPNVKTATTLNYNSSMSLYPPIRIQLVLRRIGTIMMKPRKAISMNDSSSKSHSIPLPDTCDKMNVGTCDSCCYCEQQQYSLYQTKLPLSCFPLSHYDALMQYIIKTTSLLSYMSATRILKFDNFLWKIHYHDDVHLDELQEQQHQQQQQQQQHTKQVVDEMIHRTNEFVMRAVNMLYCSNNIDKKCYHLNNFANTILQSPKPIIMSIQESMITTNNSKSLSSSFMKFSMESSSSLIFHDDQSTSNENNTVNGVKKTNQHNLIAVCIKLNKFKQPNDVIDDDEVNSNGCATKDIIDINNDVNQWDYDNSEGHEITVKAIKTMIGMKNQGDVSFLPGQSLLVSQDMSKALSLLSLSTSCCTEAIPTKTTGATMTTTSCRDLKIYDSGFDQHRMLHQNHHHKKSNKYENINIINYDDINFKCKVQDDHDVQTWHRNNQNNDCNDKDSLENHHAEYDHRLTNKSIETYCHEGDDYDSSAKNCLEESNDDHSHWYLMYWIPIPCRINSQEASTTETTTATVAVTSSALPTPQINQRNSKPISLNKK